MMSYYYIAPPPRFAFGSYGPFTAAILSFFAKDMYILKFGADPLRVGALATAISVPGGGRAVLLDIGLDVGLNV